MTTKQRRTNCVAWYPLPNHDTDGIRTMAAMLLNQRCWSQDEQLLGWAYNNRLDGFSKLVANVAGDDREKLAVLKRLRDNAHPAATKLQQFMAGLA